MDSDSHEDVSVALARRWVDEFDIRNKTILEIGCGDGRFLETMCDLGGNNGVGIDPACNPHLPAGDSGKLRLFADKCSPEYADIDADVIVCRHTLGQIAETGEFLRWLRDFIADRKDTLVLFQVFDTLRILRERAFWDISYDDCSYFSAGSLARLFRRSSFDVVELRREFDDQHILLVAKPEDGPTLPRFAQEDDMDQIRADVALFQATFPAQFRYWHIQLRRFAEQGRRVVAWGSSSKCVSFCNTLGISKELSYVVDFDAASDGNFLPGTGHPIVRPDFLREAPPDIVVAMSPMFRKEIQMELERVGVDARVVAL